jgi:hypothetical protein
LRLRMLLLFVLQLSWRDPDCCCCSSRVFTLVAFFGNLECLQG